jgi:hypothetical protein
MRWVFIDRIHINTEKVQSFHWIEGRLYVRFGANDSVVFKDPEREKYIRLCGQLGVRPVEDDENGEN